VEASKDADFPERDKTTSLGLSCARSSLGIMRENDFCLLVTDLNEVGIHE
jgi:hypothetical protein